MILDYSSKNLISKLDSVFRYLNLPIVKELDYTSAIIPAIDSLRYFYFKMPKNPDFYSKCGNYLTEIRQQAGEKLGKDNFWIMIIDNLIQENIEYQTVKIDFRQSNNARDYQMARNLQWLTEVKYPKEKIIVWAANAHVAKYMDSSRNDSQKKLIAMGSYFTVDSFRLKKSYIIGFTSYEGTAGRLGFKEFTIRKPKPNGFENWIDKTYNYAFVDFRAFIEESEPFYLKGLGHNSFFKKDWTKIFDGVFYIKNMYPCQK